MQTKQQILQLLSSAGVEPNKRLGQHFLIDLNLMRLLVDSAHIGPQDVVLEVGCGTGSLTSELAAAAGKVIAVEFDEILAQIATEELSHFDNVEVIRTDILENKNTIDNKVIGALEKTCEEYFGKLLLVANLPYNIAASVMQNLITGISIADAMVVTVQKEVADRMVATAGSDNYGKLGIFMAATGKAKIIRKLSQKVFWPIPQVESAIVRFDRDKKKVSQLYDVEFFKSVVNLFLGHRREMMRACVKFAEGDLAAIHNWHDILARSFVEPHHRPEELGVQEYISIANLCYESLH